MTESNAKQALAHAIPSTLPSCVGGEYAENHAPGTFKPLPPAVKWTLLTTLGFMRRSHLEPEQPQKCILGKVDPPRGFLTHR